MAWIVLKKIESEWALYVGRIKINHVFVALGWHRREHIENVVAVRIDEANALAVFDVLLNQRFHKRSFTRTGLSNDVEVTETILGRETHLGRRTTERVGTE